MEATVAAILSALVSALAPILLAWWQRRQQAQQRADQTRELDETEAALRAQTYLARHGGDHVGVLDAPPSEVSAGHISAPGVAESVPPGVEPDAPLRDDGADKLRSAGPPAQGRVSRPRKFR